MSKLSKTLLAVAVLLPAHGLHAKRTKPAHKKQNTCIDQITKNEGLNKDLIQAARDGNIKKVKKLLTAGADINAQ